MKVCQRKLQENVITKNTVSQLEELSELSDLIILKLLKETIEFAD